VSTGATSVPPREGRLPGDLTRDDILDNITLYWLTNTAVSAAPGVTGRHRLHLNQMMRAPGHRRTIAPCLFRGRSGA
jgi:hypothetical protein